MMTTPIEINFPLTDNQILQLLKGEEFIFQMQLHENLMIKVKVFSPDRVKHISVSDRSRICRERFGNFGLDRVLTDIEAKEDD